MNIGISAIGAFLDIELSQKVLNPWIEAKKELNITISAAQGIFPEIHNLTGQTIEKDDQETTAFLNEQYETGAIDHIKFLSVPTYEKDIRNETLPFLREKNIDLLWLLDLQDEIYTVEQIKKIINFVEKTPQFDWYKVQFKNLWGTEYYLNDFRGPRCWRFRRQDRVNLKEFAYDNDIVYEDGILAAQVPHTTIPNLLVLHHSWNYSSNDEKSKEKIKGKILFQKNHYSHSSNKWNYEKDCLELDLDYYKNNNLVVPILNKV